MGLPSRALPRLASAATELWPSFASTLAVPSRRWLATSQSLKSDHVILHHASSCSYAGAEGEGALTALSVRVERKPKPKPKPKWPVPPNFTRDRPSTRPRFMRECAPVSPLGITSRILPSLATTSPFRWPLARPSAPFCGASAIHTLTRSRPCLLLSHDRLSHDRLSEDQLSHRRGFGTEGLSRNLLSSREAAANRNPSSASAQNAFYQTLLKANMPGLVVERYQSGRFARNETADEAYQRALSMLGGSSAGHFGSPATQSTAYSDHVQAIGQAVAARNHGAGISMSHAGPSGSNGPIRVVVDETYGSIVLKWVKFIVWFGFFAYLSMIVVTFLMDSIQTTFRRPGAKMGDNEAKPEHQKARFSDVFGCDEAKEELEELVEFLRNPAKFSTLGGKLPKGVLLVGPPGTGKTLLARAVAGEAGVPFFYMSGSEFEEVYVGVGAKRVRDLFAAAKAKAPAIVFIDELDAVGGKRQPRDVSYVRQTLNQLLTELDGFEQNSGVIIMGATNFPQALDKALTRPGRFDHHITVDLPDVRGRMAILAHYLKKIKAAPDINVQAIAARTPGLSGAELENIVNQAAIHASKAKSQSVSQLDMEWAKDKVIMGSEKKSMVITEKEKLMTAYHEAGHTLVAYFGPGTRDHLYKVTVLPRGFSLGHTATLPEMDKHSHSAKDYAGWMDISMGGKVAEEIVYGRNSTTDGVSNDLDRATQMAWRMVGSFGMSDKLGPVEYIRSYDKLSSETRAMVESEVKRLLDESYARARTLLLARRKELDMLAQALVEYETLDKTEVEKVVRGEPLVGRKPVPPGPVTVPKPPSPLQPDEPFPMPPLPGRADTDPGSGGASPPPTAPPPAGGV